MTEGGHGNAALITFGLYTLAVMALAVVSNRFSRNREFVGEYFLGSRSFGVWAFAMTFAATNASGGSFMGFPALIYTHGWSLAWWISGFMFTPLLAMGLIGKRLNQIARRTNAVTIPEVLRERFGSRRVGLVATVLLVFFMFFYLLAQFKAGGKILSTLLGDEPAFRSAVVVVTGLTSGIPWVNRAEPDYLLCLLVFSAAVVVYVVYGGFRAVVWTDVLQGVVMFVGVVLMLGFALNQVGGLANATRKMAEMTPPEFGSATLELGAPAAEDITMRKGRWLRTGERVVRLAENAVIPRGEVLSKPVRVLMPTTVFEIDAVLAGLAESDVLVVIQKIEAYERGANEKGVYLRAPGPHPKDALGFLTIGTAISFFIFWPFAGTGQPSNMVRLMSFKDTKTLRHSIVTVSVYYSVIYFSLVLVFCCGRVLMPGMEIDPDRTMPDLAALLTRNAGVPWMAGLLVAAPFAAVMSSVDSFLLMVSSGVVRDVYQGSINPNAPERSVKLLSYGVTVIVGILAVLAVLNPPTYLQDLIVFASGGLAACFFIPIVLALYWPGMTARGAIAGMLGGMLAHLGLTCWGWMEQGELRAYAFLGMNPFIWDLLGSGAGSLLFSKFGPKADPALKRRFFLRSGLRSGAGGLSEGTAR
jgi:sodium/pantothenate symporter